MDENVKAEDRLADFTRDKRIVVLSGMAVVIGAVSALVAEVLGAQHGVGLIISQAQGSFDPNTVFACMVIVAVVTLVAEYLITLLEKSLLKWRPPSRSEAQAI